MSTAVVKREQRSYTAKDVTRALTAYVRLGSCAAAAREIDIPETTIDTWVKHDDHAQELVETRARHAQAAREYRAQLAEKAWKLVGQGVDVLGDVLTDGDDKDRVSATRAAADIARTLDTTTRLDAGTPTGIQKHEVVSDERVIAEVTLLLNAPDVKAAMGRQK